MQRLHCTSASPAERSPPVVLPGPAIVVIPLGLGILAAEFAWARRGLEEFRNASGRLLERLRRTVACTALCDRLRLRVSRTGESHRRPPTC